MNTVVSFGEIMLRLSTERHLRFSQSKSFAASYGGGEFNVAVSLANYGIEAEFVLPNLSMEYITFSFGKPNFFSSAFNINLFA